MPQFVRTAVAAEYYGVCDKTIRTWATRGQIQHHVTCGGHRRIAVFHKNGSRTTTPTIGIYTRVSSKKQADHKETQARAVREWVGERFPNSEIQEFTDIGSGLNFKRPGLRALLDACLSGRIQKAVVAYKDRLCRFGFDLLEWLLEKYNVEILALYSEDTDPAERITEDILAIVTVFAARVHGMRSYKKATREILDRSTSGKSIQSVGKKEVNQCRRTKGSAASQPTKKAGAPEAARDENPRKTNPQLAKGRKDYAARLYY